jgi:hypothetical protein
MNRIIPLLFVFILFSSLAFADVNEKYSYKDFIGKTFLDVDPSEFNNTEIIGSCFYQESSYGTINPMKDVFPVGMTGVTFIKCNLDNVRIPIGNTVVGGTNKRILVQNDREDWILDENNKPIEPMDKERRLAVGLSINPKDIPKTMITEEERNAHENTFFNISL